MPAKNASTPAASAPVTSPRAYTKKIAAPTAPVSASQIERRPASQRSLAAPKARRGAAPPARGPGAGGPAAVLAEREAHLLDAHRDAALVPGEDVDDGLAERGIGDAPADAGHEQEEQERGERRRGGRGDEADGAERQAAEKALARAQAVGQAPARQREEQAAQ